ncbi:hypothetical protein J4479_00830 [Candidatus Woesearchaeota archaeon]|nr:hypothetical protein [Candidatus Woesearchaeota archaeon]
MKLRISPETLKKVAYGFILTGFLGYVGTQAYLRKRNAEFEQQKSASQQLVEHQANYQFCDNLMKETAGDSGLEGFVLDKVKISGWC